MGLTRTEQWTLVAVVALIAGGFATQSWLARRAGPVVWVEAGKSWDAAALDVSGARGAGESTTSQARTGTRTPPAPSPRQDIQEIDSGQTAKPSLAIDLNAANREELQLLPGIGPVKAEAILAHRTEMGGFRTVQQLLEVKGIGPKTLEGLRPLVRIGSEPFAPKAIEVSRRSPSNDLAHLSVNIEDREIPVDVNRASSQELQTLKGIGPVLAERIIQSRLKAPFRSVDELRRVRGIGPKTLEGLRDSVVVR